MLPILLVLMLPMSHDFNSIKTVPQMKATVVKNNDLSGGGSQ